MFSRLLASDVKGVRKMAVNMEPLESLIDAINVELTAGNWPDVVLLSAQLYALLLSLGETEFAELVQDLHWIANDAVVHPLEVAAVLQP